MDFRRPIPPDFAKLEAALSALLVDREHRNTPKRKALP
jgi:hypothetical protein